MVSVYKNKNNTWFCRYRVKNYKGKTIQLTKCGFKTKSEAIKYEREQLVSYRPVNKKMLFSDVFDMFINECKKIFKISTIDNFRYINNRYFVIFSNIEISKIRLLDVLGFQNELLKILSIERANKIIALLRKVFEYSYRNNYILDNLMLRVNNSKSFEVKEKNVDFYTYEDFKKFISSFPNDISDEDFVFRVLFCILYFTGLRVNEALALKISDYRISDSVLSITKSLVRSRGKIYLLKPKTSSSIGYAYLNVYCINLLEKYLSKIDVSKCDFLFQKNNKMIFKKTLENKNKYYSEKSNVKRIRLHDFRHSFASYVYDKFGSFDIVGKLLRHKNSEQAIKTYVHIFPKKLDNAILDLISKENL